MIVLTRIDGREIVVNAEQIETVEQLPDSTISLTSGRKIIVKNILQEIIQKTIEYKRQCGLIAEQVVGKTME